MEDKLILHCEVVEIEGGRDLYNYTFDVNEKEQPEPAPPAQP
jgi:hypothetical protein